MTDGQGQLTLNMLDALQPAVPLCPGAVRVDSRQYGDRDDQPVSVRVAQMNGVAAGSHSGTSCNQQGLVSATITAWCGTTSTVMHSSGYQRRARRYRFRSMYPNGESVPCPGNDLGGCMFADASGAFICRLPVYYELPTCKPR